jgi:methanogenic corrinoid protein MtbC1
MDKNELFELIESQGYDTSKLNKNDIRKNFVDFVGSLLNEIQQLRDDLYSKEIVNTSYIDVDNGDNSKEIVNNSLIGVEKEVYDLLETSMRFSEIVTASGKSKQQVSGILKALHSKDMVKRTEYSHKNVIYSRI